MYTFKYKEDTASMIVYLKQARRRPVALEEHYMADRQGAIPFGWCSSCGREVFTPYLCTCPDCRRGNGDR